MKVSISTRGRVTLPVEIRRLDGIEGGEILEIERIGDGKYRLKRSESRRKLGLVDWLLSCPEKGFFVPIESEST